MYVDLTQNFNNHMPVFPGDSDAELVRTASVDKNGTADHQVKTGMHVGTHMDAPGHMIEGGKGLHEYPVEKFFGRGILLDARGRSSSDVDLLNGHPLLTSTLQGEGLTGKVGGVIPSPLGGGLGRG